MIRGMHASLFMLHDPLVGLLQITWDCIGLLQSCFVFELRLLEKSHDLLFWPLGITGFADSCSTAQHRSVLTIEMCLEITVTLFFLAPRTRSFRGCTQGKRCALCSFHYHWWARDSEFRVETIVVTHQVPALSRLNAIAPLLTMFFLMCYTCATLLHQFAFPGLSFDFIRHGLSAETHQTATVVFYFFNWTVVPRSKASSPVGSVRSRGQHVMYDPALCERPELATHLPLSSLVHLLDCCCAVRHALRALTGTQRSLVPAFWPPTY